MILSGDSEFGFPTVITVAVESWRTSDTSSSAGMDLSADHQTAPDAVQYNRLGALNNKNFSQFRRLEVQDQGV